MLFQQRFTKGLVEHKELRSRVFYINRDAAFDAGLVHLTCIHWIATTVMLMEAGSSELALDGSTGRS